MNRFVPVLALLALVVSGCDLFSPARALCARTDECRKSENVDNDNDDSDDGSDDVAVCTASSQSFINAWKANQEPECHELATAYETLLSCSAGLSCKDIVENDLSGCEDENEAFNKRAAKNFEDKIDCEVLAF